DPGTPVRSTSDSGVWRKRPPWTSANTPTLASARSTRNRLGAWVPVFSANSARSFGPAASASATRSLAATDRAIATHLPKIIWVMTASGGGGALSDMASLLDVVRAEGTLSAGGAAASSAPASPHPGPGSLLEVLNDGLRHYRVSGVTRRRQHRAALGESGER